MAVVNKPRNNLQQHLAWFNTQKPQVPPRTQTPHPSLQQVVTVANLPPVVANLIVPQPITVSHNETTGGTTESSLMPTPANLRSSKLAAPRRSDPNPKRRETESVVTDVPAPSSVLKVNSLVDRVRNDWAQQGTCCALMPDFDSNGNS